MEVLKIDGWNNYNFTFTRFWRHNLYLKFVDNTGFIIWLVLVELSHSDVESSRKQSPWAGLNRVGPCFRAFPENVAVLWTCDPSSQNTNRDFYCSNKPDNGIPEKHWLNIPETVVVNPYTNLIYGFRISKDDIYQLTTQKYNILLNISRTVGHWNPQNFHLKQNIFSSLST